MFNIYDTPESCCGCGACEAVCNRNAISMICDREGFWYPKIDDSKCILCKACIKVCSFKAKDREKTREQQKFYYAQSKNKDILYQSSSGGIFTHLYQYFLENHGAVCGSIFTEDLTVKHKLSSLESDCQKMRGSKYVQSELSGIFKEIEKLLKSNHKVLFIGTPCQVAGLKGYLKNIDLNNLIMVDLICHGVPSPLVWKDYIQYLQQKYGTVVSKFSFRDKKQGWKGFNISAECENGIILKNSRYVSSYIELYGQGAILRPSCYQCRYSSLTRPSDLTIGDFWGIDQLYPEFDDDRGVSMVLANTRKGNELFCKINNQLKWFEVSKDDILFKQPNLKNPAQSIVSRKRFWKYYTIGGYKKAANIYTQTGTLNYIKAKVKKMILNR